MRIIQLCLLLLLQTRLFAFNPPDLTFRVFGDGDPVSGAVILAKISTPGCTERDGRIIFTEVGKTDHNGNVVLADTTLKRRLWQQCKTCACWETGKTEVRYRVTVPGFIRADGAMTFEARKGASGPFTYEENYYIDVILTKDAAAATRPSEIKWGRFEIKTPQVPGAAYYMENGVWVTKKTGAKGKDAPVSLTLRITVKSNADKRPLDNVGHFYAWGHDVECGDTCVTGNGPEYLAVLGKSPAVYNSANFPKTCRLHLQRIGFHDFDADIPISNIAAPEEVVDVYMEPLR